MCSNPVSLDFIIMRTLRKIMWVGNVTDCAFFEELFSFSSPLRTVWKARSGPIDGCVSVIQFIFSSFTTLIKWSLLSWFGMIVLLFLFTFSLFGVSWLITHFTCLPKSVMQDADHNARPFLSQWVIDWFYSVALIYHITTFSWAILHFIMQLISPPNGTLPSLSSWCAIQQMGCLSWIQYVVFELLLLLRLILSVWCTSWGSFCSPVRTCPSILLMYFISLK